MKKEDIKLVTVTLVVAATCFSLVLILMLIASITGNDMINEATQIVYFIGGVAFILHAIMKVLKI